MTDDSSATAPQPAFGPTAGFARRLNEKGYPFHYAVLHRAGLLRDQNKTSPFLFERAEMPVELRGKDTRIDGVLRNTNRRGGILEQSLTFIAIECKRANPALANWCFARAPYVRYNHGVDEQFVVDRIKRPAPGAVEFILEPLRLFTLRSAYRIGYEANAPVKGDAAAGKSGAIEDGVTQALRGAAGLIDLYAREPRHFTDVHRVAVIPVVVTTAALWVTDAMLETAHADTGDLDPKSVKFERVNAVAFQYNRSASLTPQHPTKLEKRDLRDLVDSEYVRTVHILNIEALDKFLPQLGESLPDVYRLD